MTDLRHAIARDTLLLLFQPKLHMESKRASGEAQVRWDIPVGAGSPPASSSPSRKARALYLKQMPVDHIKIDQPFVSDLDT